MEEIGNSACQGCEKLVDVIIAFTVKKIGGGGAFKDTALKEVRTSRLAEFIKDGGNRSFPETCKVTFYD